MRIQDKGWVWITAGVLILAVSTVLASSNVRVQGFERDVFMAVYGLPQFLKWPMVLVTQAGSAWLLLGLCFGLIWRHRYTLCIRVLTAGGIAFVLTEALKRLIARPRPSELFVDAPYRDLLVSGYGFPSGHTAMATAVAVTLYFYLPKNLRWAVPVWILLVGISRVYLGVHAPLDVVGGLGVGLIAAYTQKMFKKFPLELKYK